MTNVILGGGISGLSTAFYLSKILKNDIKIYESQHRLGGWIKSKKNENGIIFEQGPRTLRCGGKAAENTLQLVKELGLHSLIRPVLKSSEAAKNRMIYFNNQLISLPNSWTALFKINPPFIRPLCFAIINDLRTPKKLVSDESIYDFVSRRFGKDYAEIPLSAMICGIFAGDAKEISVKALMLNLFEKEQQFGSVFGGMLHSFKNNFKKSRTEKKNNEKNSVAKQWSVWSLENGLETLPKHLHNYLLHKNNVNINLSAKCTKVKFKDGKILLTINDKTEVASHLYSSLPSKDLGTILDDEFCFLKKELLSIPFVDVAVVNLAYEGDLIEKKGFGFLVPPNQNLPILGIIFDSCITPQEGKTVLTVMMGGKWFKHYFGIKPEREKFLEIAQEQIKNILKIDKEPSDTSISVLKECIPQYVVGHTHKIKQIRQFIADRKLPMTLIGNSFDGVGVNDAILSAKTGVEESIKRFQYDQH